MTRVFTLILALIAGPAFAEKPSPDLTNVRGFNYTTSLDTSIGPRGHSGLWLKYDAAQVERDLTNAQRLNLNQVRVFIAYSAWKADPELSNRNLLDFLHACQRHNIGVMLGLIDQCQGRSKTRPVGRSKSRPVVGGQIVEYSGEEGR